MTETPEISKALWHFIVAHPTETKIALMPVDDMWTLPSMPSGTPMNAYWALYIDGYKVQQLWDWDVAVMYQANYFPVDNFNDVRVVYVLDNIDGHADLPDGAQWFSSDDIADITFDEEHIAGILQTCFAEQTEGIPEKRAPWGRVGWHKRAMGWIQSQLGAHSYQQTSDIEMVRIWCITAMYKVETNQGYLYFKAVPPVFKREIMITRWLREQFGNAIPQFVAYDTEQNFMLMKDFGGTPLRGGHEHTEITTWKSALNQYGKLQAQTAPYIDALLALGALDWRIETLLPQFEDLLQDEEFVKPNWEITAEQIEQVRQTLPQVKAHIEALQAMNLPNTILHGDFHAGNININDEQVIFYDWTDAAIGMPLLDLHPIVHWDLNGVFDNQPDAIESVLDAYFEGLSGDIPRATWKEAYEHSQIVAIVYHALNYRHLLSKVEPNERWILDTMGNLLKSLIAKLSLSE